MKERLKCSEKEASVSETEALVSEKEALEVVTHH